MSSLHTIDQMKWLSDRFEEDGITPAQVTLMGQGGRLRAIKTYLDGDAEIRMIEKPEKPATPVEYLRLISGGKSVVIPALDGKRNFVKARKIFKWGFDGDFVNWGLDVPSDPTPEMPVDVYEMIPGKDGNFKTVLDSTGRPDEALFLTQAQALSFVETNPDWLRKGGYATFIPFKEKVKNKTTGEVEVQFFVASVDVDAVDGLRANVDRFSYDNVWYGDCRHRFVLQQLKTA